ncbi:MAG: zinc-ribbon domain-containing protein [Deltaproteobacteria bacterium]|nr:zinc-ribbon domain-containing protein [Deltaproteobacteria bacterium]
MIVECKSCHTRFKISDDKVTPRGVKVRCSKCRYTFVIRPDDNLERAGAAAEHRDAPFGNEATAVDRKMPFMAPAPQTMQMYSVSPVDLRTAQRAANFDLDATDISGPPPDEQRDPFLAPKIGAGEQSQFTDEDVPPTSPLSARSRLRTGAADALFSPQADVVETVPRSVVPGQDQDVTNSAANWSAINERAIHPAGSASGALASAPQRAAPDPFAARPAADPFANIDPTPGSAVSSSAPAWSLQVTDKKAKPPAPAFTPQHSDIDIDIDVEIPSPFEGVPPAAGAVVDPFASIADAAKPPAGMPEGVSAEDLFSGLGIPAQHDIVPPPTADFGPGLDHASGFDQVGGEQKTTLRSVDEGVLKLLAEYDAQEKAAAVAPAAPAVGKTLQPPARVALWWHLLQAAGGLVVIAGLLIGIYQFRGGVIAELTPQSLFHVVLWGPQGFSADDLVTQHVAVSYYPVGLAQRQIVVLGEVRNAGAAPLPGVLVTGQLVDRDQQVVGTEEVYAGATVTPFDLGPSTTSSQLARLIKQRVVAASTTLAPGAVWPFSIVFAQIPDDAHFGRVKVEARAADLPRAGDSPVPSSAPDETVQPSKGSVKAPPKEPVKAPPKDPVKAPAKEPVKKATSPAAASPEPPAESPPPPPPPPPPTAP